MAATEVRRVCVIGAGSAGLTTIKNLKEYGLDVIAFEKSNDFAGIWKYKPATCDGQGTVMKNTILNTSKEFISFSDFPTKKEDANFMRNSEVYEFLKSYAEHFDLLKHIQFQTEIVSLQRTPDYERTGQWSVTTKRNNNESTEVFDAVMVCTGHHAYPSISQFKGMEKFTGSFIHSHDYKTARPYEDRRVLVVGLGNSGGDILCELGKVAKKTLGCSRRGTWVTQRVLRHGYPRDIILRTRYREKLWSLLPKPLHVFLTNRMFNERIDHKLYGLRPNVNAGTSPAMMCDDLPLHLASGWVELRVGIEKFDEHGVLFEDGTYDEIDDVILCTGYDFDFNWIENGKAVPVQDNQTRLWRRIFPPDHKFNTLAIIGFVDPLGPTITCSEAQSRMVAHYWANHLPLPREREMQKEIDEDKVATRLRWNCSDRKASLQIDHTSYFDLMADMIGVLPDISWGLFLRDPRLAVQLTIGPVTAHQYRLRGPNSWENARKQLLGTCDRVHYGMNTRQRRELDGTFDADRPTVYAHLVPIVGEHVLIATVLILATIGLMKLILLITQF